MVMDHCVHAYYIMHQNHVTKKITKTIQNCKNIGVYKIVLKLGGKVERTNLIFSNPIHTPR